MLSKISIIATLATFGSLVAADNIYTYINPGCQGCAFFFKDIDHNVCAVSITGNASSIADAIAKGYTTVQSGKFVTQECGQKHFLGWDDGPGKNADGPLQCGTVVGNEKVWETETCIGMPPYGVDGFHGFSWTEPSSSTSEKRDQWTCTGSVEPDGVVLNGKNYNLNGISQSDADRLKELAMAGGGEVPADLQQHEVAQF